MSAFASIADAAFCGGLAILAAIIARVRQWAIARSMLAFARFFYIFHDASVFSTIRLLLPLQ
jgi:hypothetical protein